MSWNIFNAFSNNKPLRFFMWSLISTIILLVSAAITKSGILVALLIFGFVTMFISAGYSLWCDFKEETKGD